MVHLEVAVAAPIHQTLTYSYSGSDSHLLRPGIRLLVPLGRRKVTGYLLSLGEAQTADYEIKEISEILDSSPLFPEKFITFFRWIANHYRYPLGEVIKNCLPGGLTSRTDREVSLTEGTDPHDLSPECPEEPPPWLRKLVEEGSTRISGATKLSPTWKKRLAGWQDKGLIENREVIVRSRTKPKTETYVFLRDDSPGDDLKVSEEKTLAAITSFPDWRRKGIPRKELNKVYQGAAKALKELDRKGIVEIREERVFRDPLGDEPPCFARPEQLTEEQEQAMAEIIPALRAHSFRPFLVHGVTGCGKTEIYLRAAEETLNQGRSVLVLVPEITLASQMTGHFFSRFDPKRLAVLHSGISSGERLDQWQRIMEGAADIVIGARSAIFAPLEDCGLIIVDEEHDPAYKQEDQLRYQARDLAVLIASRSRAVVLLGSATPSLASFQNSEQGKYRLLSLTKRVDNQQLPEVSIVDLRTDREGGAPLLFSRELLDGLRLNLEKGEQSIIFLNRRGYASFMLCLDCGNPVQCRRCDISLTLHKGQKILACHHCGYSVTSAIVCPNCRSPRIREIGFGTERVEEELQNQFPEAAIARLDRDTTAQRGSLMTILKKVRRREIDILVGTQMISKGHHFPDITLVGVLWADAGLGLPDFKAGERTFQLLTQVTGRAGRGEKKGRVIIQTHQPGHYAITCAREHDYHKFYRTELEMRQRFQFPPYSRLACLTLAGKKEETVKEAATQTADLIKKKKNTEELSLLGPVPSPLSKIKGRYRWQVLLKSRSHQELHRICEQLTAYPPSLLRSRSVSLTVDIDPENML
ncbi:MAG: primosomal protein N' [Desulfurivibrionaceae bacterium]